MKKKSRKKTVITICLLVPIILVVGAVLGTVMPLVISYQKNAYEKAEIVERSEEYVMPEKESQPAEWEDVTISADELGQDFTEPETLPKDVNESENASKVNTGRWNSFSRNENAISVYGKTPIYKVEKKDPDVENILILGTDSRDVTRERGRSDSIIIMSYNRRTGSIKMISVLRDSLVPIEGHRWNRINAAYSFDGVGLAINTINEIFDLDIQRFAVVDFNGAKEFIDKVGGIDITLTKAEADYYNKTGEMYKEMHPGISHMTGSMALKYMRTRKLDNDFGRTARQRNVIQAMANKIITEKNLGEIYELLEYAFTLVKTNISISELTGVVTSVVARAMGRELNLESQHVPFSDSYAYKRYNGMAIISFDIDEAAKRINGFIYG